MSEWGRERTNERTKERDHVRTRPQRPSETRDIQRLLQTSLPSVLEEHRDCTARAIPCLLVKHALSRWFLLRGSYSEFLIHSLGSLHHTLGWEESALHTRTLHTHTHRMRVDVHATCTRSGMHTHYITVHTRSATRTHHTHAVHDK